MEKEIIAIDAEADLEEEGAHVEVDAGAEVDLSVIVRTI